MIHKTILADKFIPHHFFAVNFIKNKGILNRKVVLEKLTKLKNAPKAQAKKWWGTKKTPFSVLV
jgi:hypothetical protein